MWQKAYHLLLLTGFVLGFASPAGSIGGAIKGTWNSDLTCGGYPEERCGRPPLMASNQLESRTGSCQTSLAPPFLSFASASLRSLQFDMARFAGGASATRIDPQLGSAWLTSGAWMADGTLLLVDASRQQILRLDPSGRWLPSPKLPVSAREIRPTPDGFLLKVDSLEFVATDRELRPKRYFSLTPTETSSVRGIFNWVPVADTVLAFADVEERNSYWASGWVRISLASPGNHEMLRSVPLNAWERRIYPLGLPYLTSLGTNGYFLASDGAGIRLFRVSLGQPGGPVRELSGLLLNLPLLPGGGGAEAAIARYRELERSSAPAGLYGNQGKLYLLTRRLGSAGTEWLLHRLDPETGSELGRLVLPVTASNLLIIPGKKHWAVIEKGPVLGPGRQEVKSVLFLLTTWVEGQFEKKTTSGSRILGHALSQGEGRALRRVR